MKNDFNWFGIDFGTTNSAGVSLTGENKESVELITYGDEQGRPHPSLVAINKTTGEVKSGREVKDQMNALLEDYECFSSIKSLLDSDKEWYVAGKNWTAVDIAAEILKSLKQNMEKNAHNKVTEAVFAVPVGFPSTKKDSLRQAARVAGINVKMFVSEPTAAFISNYNALRGCKNVAVFDWGGGTLDIAVLHNNNGKISELATDGMEFAGNDIDRLLAEKFHSLFMSRFDNPVSFEEMDAQAQDALLTKCESAKCDFEDEDLISVSLNRYGDYGNVRQSMNYATFSKLLENSIFKALKCLEQAIAHAGMNKTTIDKIVCVGGSSRLRPLRDALETIYGKDLILYPEQVMWDIAKGAAFISTRMSEKTSYELSSPIGIELCNGEFFPLIKAGQRIPCEESTYRFGITTENADGSKEANIILCDSTDSATRDLYELLSISLRDFNDEYLSISCFVDDNNILRLKAGSSRTHDSLYKVWTYGKLKVSFQLENDI